MIKNHSLAKAIADQGWYSFLLMLDYKLKAKGGCLIKIDRWAASTKTCSRCDAKQHITLNERTYVCGCCGLIIDRDLNAALNIKRWGMLILLELLKNTAGTAGIHALGDITSGVASKTAIRKVSKNKESNKSPLGDAVIPLG